jgi:hypothetical protein
MAGHSVVKHGYTQKNLNYFIISRFVSYIHLKIYEKEILLVGVYMPFDNSKNKKETLSLYEISLSLLATLICKAQSNDIPIFIIGDFNVDLKRKNKFDEI